MVRLFACISLASMLTGCCAWRTRGQALGRIETYVIFADRECKCPNPRIRYGLSAKAGDTLKVYLREVFYNGLNKGVSGRKISLRVVDATGDPVTGVVLQPTMVTTDAKGFGAPISISSSTQGVFLIEATYSDKRAPSTSYSMPIRPDPLKSAEQHGGVYNPIRV
jgi:hypothetical protein